MSNVKLHPSKEYDYSELSSEFFGSLISPKSFSDELRGLLYYVGMSAIILQRNLPDESLVPHKLEEALFSISELCPILDRMEQSKKTQP